MDKTAVQTTVNIITTIAIMFWPLMFMTSPMMFDAPGSENDKSNVVILMLILCYPAVLFLFLWITGSSYFGIKASTMLVISCVVITTGFALFGYFGMLYNLYRGIANTGYSVVNDNVYYDAKPIKGADAKSFGLLNENSFGHFNRSYARDRQNLYYRGKALEGVIPDALEMKKLAGNTYLINKSQVIYYDKILPGAEPETFGDFDGFDNWTFSDNHNQYIVYSGSTPLPAVDKSTFKPLSSTIAKDHQHIFSQHTRILPEADTASFELLEDTDFARDNMHVYYLSTNEPFVIQGADPATFQVLDRGYLKDKNYVYHVQQYESVDKVEIADVDSFKVTHYDEDNKSEAFDKNHYYYDAKIVGDR